MPKNKKKKKGGSHFGGHHGYKGVPKKKAKKLTNSILKQEIGDLRSQKQSVKKEARNEQHKVAREYAAAKGDLEYTHKETSKHLNRLGRNQQRAFSNARSQQEAAQAALQASLAQGYDSADRDLSQELGRLGIQDAANKTALIQDEEFMQSLAANQGQSASSTLGLAQSNAQQLSNSLKGITQGSMMSSMGQAVRGRREGMRELANQRDEQLGKLNDAIASVRKQRPDIFFQLLNQLQETGWNQYLQGQQMNLQNRQFNFQKKQANKK